MGRLNRLQAVLAALLFVVPSVGAECISTIRTVSQPVVFPSHAAGPVAWTGSVLGVAKVDIDTNVVYFATYDANMNQLLADRIVSNASLGGPLALLWNGSEFALFYQRDDLQLVFQRISLSGDAIGTAIAVAPKHLQWQNQEYDIAWDARRQAYDVIHTIPAGFERAIWLTIVGRDGEVKLDQPLSIYMAITAEPRVAVAPSGEIGVTWIREDFNGAALYFLLFGTDNNIKELTEISVNGRDTRLAASDDSFLIVSTVRLPGNTSELRSARVDLTGKVIAADATLVRARGVDIAPLELIWNPTLREWALTYNESINGFDLFPGEMRLLRLEILGAQSDTLFTPDPTKNIYQMRFPFVWTGASYSGSIERPGVPRNQGSDTYLVKHCPLIAEVTAPTHTAIYGLTQFTGSASGGTPDYAFHWDFGDTGLGEGRNPKHQYLRTGTYTVTLTATDSAGGLSVSTATVLVVIPKQRAVRH
ncbi:MAG: glycosyl hydrolase [Acidobacteria bacterium]|nr:glycosyl hydrolase [Acidobacteriota bacterium]